jgi:hypothetical protein
MARAPLPEELEGIEPAHHGQLMKYKSGRLTWEGDYCIMTGRWICDECGLRVEVQAKQYESRMVDG